MATRRVLIEARAKALARKWARDANKPTLMQILNILNFRPPKTRRRLYGDERTGMDYDTLFECLEELGELMDSWLAAGCRLELWAPKRQFEEDLNRRKLRLTDRDGVVGYHFTRPTREEQDLGLGGGYTIDARPGRTEAVVMFFDFIIGPFQKDVGRCKRCRKYFWNRWGHADKAYCGSRCSSADTATRATRERRNREHQSKLETVRTAIRRYEQLSTHRRSRLKRTWSSWVANEAGPGVTPNFVTRAVNQGELTPPVLTINGRLARR